MVYGLLKEDMDRVGGIHALQLKTMTVEEEAIANESRSPEGAVEQGNIQGS